MAVTPVLAAPASATVPPFRVVTEPGAGMGFFYTAISGARHSIELEMYELSDPVVVADLEARARAHVDVEVLLDRDYDAGSVNAPAYAALAAHHVAVRWADASYIFHEKAMVVDGATAYIGTGNLTAEYYATTRDFWVVDTKPADVAAVVAAFRADWHRGPPGAAGSGDDLVWSPGAQPTVLALIDSARHSVWLESEELSSTAVVDALEAAARRGVAVRVTMTYDSSWAWAFRALEAAGAAVRVDYGETPIYIHAKALCVDCVIGAHGSGRVLVGSQNLAYDSLNVNRELSVDTTSSLVVQPIAKVLRSDFAAASPYS